METRLFVELLDTTDINILVAGKTIKDVGYKDFGFEGLVAPCMVIFFTDGAEIAFVSDREFGLMWAFKE